MASIFHLDGSYSVCPASGFCSGDPSIDACLDEQLVLKAVHVESFELTSSSPVIINFGNVTNAHVVVIRVYGAHVKATLTSADGTNQSVPVDPLFVEISMSVPITALTLTRDSGSTFNTTVKLLLGEKAS